MEQNTQLHQKLEQAILTDKLSAASLREAHKLAQIMTVLSARKPNINDIRNTYDQIKARKGLDNYFLPPNIDSKKTRPKFENDDAYVSITPQPNSKSSTIENNPLRDTSDFSRRVFHIPDYESVPGFPDKRYSGSVAIGIEDIDTFVNFVENKKIENNKKIESLKTEFAKGLVTRLAFEDLEEIIKKNKDVLTTTGNQDKTEGNQRLYKIFLTAHFQAVSRNEKIPVNTKPSIKRRAKNHSIDTNTEQLESIRVAIAQTLKDINESFNSKSDGFEAYLEEASPSTDRLVGSLYLDRIRSIMSPSGSGRF